MKAMIFAAGLGTRLRPLTDDRPKALVEVAGKTMLQRVIERVALAGITSIVVNVHHFADKVIDYLRDHDNFGLDIAVSDERDLLLDTGGGVLKAQQLLMGDEPILLHNADIMTTLDLGEMIAHHQNSGAAATLLVKPRVTQRYLVFDANARLQGWVNKKTGEVRPAGFNIEIEGYQELAFGGVHVISPAIFEALQRYGGNRQVFGIVPFYVDACRDLLINGYQPQEPYQWFDAGKPETLAQASEAMSS